MFCPICHLTVLKGKKIVDSLIINFARFFTVNLISKGFREAPIFHGLYLRSIVIAVLTVMIPSAPLPSILYLSQEADGLLHFALIFMRVIIND